jgi:hypothetical protein
METCKKIIINTAYGVKYKRSCTKIEYKDGLCRHHFNRHESKTMNWEDRSTYRFALKEDLDTGRSLKLKGTNCNTLYQGRKGCIKMWSKKQNKYVSTNLPYDFNLFCTLD